MWSKQFITTITLAAGLFAHVNAHAGVSPALGVKGTLTRNGVQQPNGGKACGNVDIAKNIDSSTPVKAGADGSFTVTGANFNGGGDGSTSFTVQISADGTGKNFVAGKVTKNGDPAPKQEQSTVQITAQLPAGTKCTGGKAGNACLAAFKSSAGFGNCVVVTQGAGKRSNIGGSRMARAAREETPVKRATGAADFGNCVAPAIKFADGLDGRKEASFAPATAPFDHGSALNAKVITGFICSQLKDKCQANKEAVAACEAAASTANNLKGQAAADSFNNALKAAAAKKREVVIVKRAAADFGSCATPAIKFADGLDGRKEASFAPATADFNHGSALNAKVITGFICQQLADKCKANQEAISACQDAAKAADGAKGQASADAFNNALKAVAKRSTPEVERRAATDFGNCATPAIKFADGLDGRKEASFAPATSDFNHGSALNAKVITGFICSQLSSQCKAGADAVAKCEAAASQANNLKGQAAADAFNKAISA